MSKKTRTNAAKKAHKTRQQRAKVRHNAAVKAWQTRRANAA